MIHGARILLIRIGKILPFIVCSIVAVSYIESAFALYTENFVLYDNCAVLNKPVSFFIGEYFEYNVQTLFVLCVISIAIETCLWNRLACLYLGINLLEKSYFDFEIEPSVIYAVCMANIMISTFLVYKGIRVLSKC